MARKVGKLGKASKASKTGERHGAAFVVGAVVGGVAGAAATLWTTPRSGLELRSRMMGGGDDYAPGGAALPHVRFIREDSTPSGRERLSSRALGVVERVAAPLVGVRLGETAEERGETAAPTGMTGMTGTPDTTGGVATVETEEILVAPGEASGEPAPGDRGPGHIASTEELSAPVPGALDQSAEPQTKSDRFTPFPHGDEPSNSPT